jgi:hypothetical protein
MCYNSTMSFTLAALGIIATLYVYAYSPKLVQSYLPMLLIFYSAMELLQGTQYFFVNQCDNKTNKLLTEVAYIFVIVQPLLWNFFFYLNSNKCEKKIFVVGMLFAIVWIFFNVLSRLLYSPNLALDYDDSIVAFNKVCTKKDKSHLYWTWTLANLGDYNATYLTYLMIWFIPALVTYKHRITSVISMIGFVIANLMAMRAKEIIILTSVWCYISVPVLITIAISIVNVK